MGSMRWVVAAVVTLAAGVANAASVEDGTLTALDRIDATDPATLGLPNNNPSRLGKGIPQIVVSGISGIGNSNLFPFTDNLDTFQFIDNLTFLRGKHSFKTGVDIKYLQIDGLEDLSFAGTIVFDGGQSGISAVEAGQEIFFEARIVVVVRIPGAVGELAVARLRAPGWHVPAQHFLFDRARPRACLLVGAERDAEVVLGVTHQALAVDDAADFLVEGHRRLDALVRLDGAGPPCHGQCECGS